jgi:methylthioribulose 1-phosphate dehydratase/enolase-phosphatase E1
MHPGLLICWTLFFIAVFIEQSRSTAFDSAASIQPVQRKMRLHYLDNPNEKASTAILRQLGVSTGEAISGKAVKLPQTFLDEHKSSAPVTIKVASGEISVDVRDSADCWVRAYLHKDESVTLPANLYRRIAPGDSIGDVSAVISSTSDVIKRYTEEPDSVSLNTYHSCRELVCELCRQFFTAGWVTGTGGSISIRHGNRIYMTPSGVQKERILPDELYVVDIDGELLHAPERKPGGRAPKLSDCAPLFLHAFKQRNAGKSICMVARYLHFNLSESTLPVADMLSLTLLLLYTP